MRWRCSKCGITTRSGFKSLAGGCIQGGEHDWVTMKKKKRVQDQELLLPPPQDIGSFVFIQGGTFNMGSPLSEPKRMDDETQHIVTVSSFYIGKYVVTQQEYQEVIGSNPSTFKGDYLPVEKVSWYDAITYCNRRSQREGLSPVYRDNVTWDRSANGYRLPTEAEWEYGCRAGTSTPFSTGNNITTDQANYDGNYPYNEHDKGICRMRTTPVGSFAPNPWGLYDMHGNVWEWCWDRYGDYDTLPQTDPAGASSGSDRVGRGGSWYYNGQKLRSACRNSRKPSYRSNVRGFRVVRNGRDKPPVSLCI